MVTDLNTSINNNLFENNEKLDDENIVTIGTQISATCEEEDFIQVIYI